MHCYLSQLVPDKRQDIIEGVETLDRKVSYDRDQSCTSDEAQTVVKRRSKFDCALACTEQHGCRDYTFDETTKDCSLYKHKALFFEDKQSCYGYKAS